MITEVSLFRTFLVVLQCDLVIGFRQRGDMLNPVVFFLMVVTMMPLGITPQANTLAGLAPGLLWVVALLACLLSLNSLFRADFEDGSLEQLILRPQSLYFVVIAKVIAHWLTIGLPLTLVAPLLGILLSLPAEGVVPLWLSLLLGTMTLSLIGGIGAALTVSLSKGGLLLSLIIMPLYVPVLIFGASSVRFAVEGLPYLGTLAVLGTFCALALILAPLATVGALKMSVQE
ncbi:heme exporter protein CcmB [Candidatus Endobugula sertula]|uniref:Heme exporter protein B n=1 Tax=Candidatus Endobugula sertula TaxID=62101 RepID=A0A1D2QT19_9GAMM|nr:heme exporter protein CcmB [Candidatus Endobugula sertula]